MKESLLNLQDYSPLEMFFYCAGAILWATTYIVIIRNIYRYRFAAVPAIGICGYIAWEIWWGYLYESNTGALFSWGLKIYAPLSGVILWHVFLRGEEYFTTRSIQRVARFVLAAALFSWLLVLFFLIPAIDDQAGMTTAVILQAVLATGYIPLLLNEHDRHGLRGLTKMSYSVAWLKMLAGANVGAFCVAHLPGRHWLHAIVFIVFALDLAYIAIFRHLRHAKRHG